jgi:hypothetical protein
MWTLPTSDNHGNQSVPKHNNVSVIVNAMKNKPLTGNSILPLQRKPIQSNHEVGALLPKTM